MLKPTHASVVIDNGDVAYIATSKAFVSGIDGGTKTAVDGQEAIVKLDGKGNELEAGGNPVFIHFGVYAEKEHGKLKLPSRRL